MYSKLVREFLQYHRENPHVYIAFKKFALQAIGSGRANFGAHAVCERLRWYTQIETKGDAFKLNNNYSAFYSRMFIRDHPRHADFFRLRAYVADELFQ